MVGCFNISLFSYFDIHRIFDLLSYRTWDFVLWWFDLDFVVFDFNFDFIMCISFIFIFLIHFFLKLLFSFIVNYVLINSILIIDHIKLLLCTTIINFITFFFVTGILICILLLEVFSSVSTICFQDFIGFFEVSITQLTSFTKTALRITHIYIMFYYILNIVNNVCLVVLRFFFSYMYENFMHTDYIINTNSINVKCMNLSFLWIINGFYIINNLTNIYNYAKILGIFVICMFTLVGIFYTFLLFIATMNAPSRLLFLKSIRYLNTLEIKFTVAKYKGLFSNITYLHLFTYIIFIINYFSIIIKDFNYINFVLSTFTSFHIFTYYVKDNNTILKRWFKKQLSFITSF